MGLHDNEHHYNHHPQAAASKSTGDPSEPKIKKDNSRTSGESRSAPGSPKSERKSLPPAERSLQENVEEENEGESSSDFRTSVRISTTSVTYGSRTSPTSSATGLLSAASNGLAASASLGSGLGYSATLTKNNSAVGLVQLQDSDGSDQLQVQSTSNSRSRQKKFMKNFKQLPQEEVVLQRYSCALVGDILLQGHLYITENYFAFYSNVFGYVTKLQIPIRSVTKISKEKTARIIPNAVGLLTNEEKHVFGSLLSRDSTFKFMTHTWKRALRLQQNDLILDTGDNVENVLETEIDDEDEVLPDDLSSDSALEDLDPPAATLSIPQPGKSEIEPYLVKRMSQCSGTIFYQTRHRKKGAAFQGPPTPDMSEHPSNRRTDWLSFFTLSRATLLSLLLIVLLLFLLCSSVYLVFRINSLQQQVESQYSESDFSFGGLHSSSTDRMRKVLDSNVDQISTVRKSLEKLSSLLENAQKKDNK